MSGASAFDLNAASGAYTFQGNLAHWYRAGNEHSDRQWRDILGIILVQSGLDDAYLQDGARKLGVVDLLDRAMRERRNS